MKEAIFELAHREYTMRDYANAEIHCKQVNHVTGVTYRVKTYDKNDRFFGLALILEVSELPISSRSDVSGSELSGVRFGHPVTPLIYGLGFNRFLRYTNMIKHLLLCYSC